MDGQVDEEKMEKIAKNMEDQEENGYIRYNYKLKD